MLTLKLLVKDNWRTMVKVEKNVADGVEKGLQATAEAIVADIKESWSGYYPPSSIKGNPPAIRSEVLNDSVVVDKQGRDEAGRFAGKDAKAYYIHVDTSEGDPDGYNYAQALEDPDYLDRPFIAPALDRAEGYFTSNIQRFMRL